MCPATPADFYPHKSVLYQPIIHALRPQSPGFYVDGTLGAGGHAWGILKSSSPAGQLLGLDLDPGAIEIARQRLMDFQDRAVLRQASYTSLADQLRDLGWPPVDGILLDLGVSSMQLDQAQRGFSFQKDGPLDMRFSPDQPTSAADLVNKLAESELADIIWRFGEEPQSRRISRAIIQARPLHTTLQLAEVIRKAASGRSKIHPATLTFQALRIAVNAELQSIAEVLPQAIGSLKPGGRLAVISFHSLEDRLVKQTFRWESRDCICPPKQPICTCGHKASILEVNRHPITADEAEIQENPRARSARLRVVEKL